MPHLQTILIPRGDEHSMANLGSVLKLARGGWEPNSTTHEMENILQWVSAGKLVFGSMVFLSSFEKFREK